MEPQPLQDLLHDFPFLTALRRPKDRTLDVEPHQQPLNVSQLRNGAPDPDQQLKAPAGLHDLRVCQEVPQKGVRGGKPIAALGAQLLATAAEELLQRFAQPSGWRPD